MTVLAVFRERIPLVPVLAMGGVDQLKLLRRWIGVGAPDYVVTPTDQELLSHKCAHGFFDRATPSPLEGMDSEAACPAFMVRNQRDDCV